MPKTLALGQGMAWRRKRALLRGIVSAPDTGGGVQPPEGFVFLLGADGAQLLGADGAYLYGAA